MNFTRSTSETMTSFQATLVNTGFGQLVLRDSLGKVAQKWTLSNPKCVIGTGTNCNVSCQLPGIGDHHVLLIIGARQVFIRALAAGLTRNGQNVTELVIPGNEPGFDFEIAGHHFQYSREGVSTPVTKEFVQEASTARPLFATAYNDAPAAVASEASANTAEKINVEKISVEKIIDNVTNSVASAAALPASTLTLAPSRLKFTVVRALEKNRQSVPGAPATIDNGLTAGRPAWVEAIVRDALRPVEERLDDLNGPLQNLERGLRRQQAQLRKARKASQAGADSLPAQPQFVPVLAPELIQSQAFIEQAVQKHAAQLEKVTLTVGQIVGRLSDVDQQLTTTQADRQELSLQFQQSNQQIVALQQEMLALFNGLQLQLKQPAQSETNSQTRLWQSNVEAQLAELQATLLTLDDVKTTLAAAVEQNRLLKGDLEVQQQKFGKAIAESTHNAIADAMAQANNTPETIGQIVGDKVCDNLREQLGARFTNEIAQQLSDSLNNEFAQPLSSQLSTQISTQISSQITSEMTRQFSQVASPAPVAANNDEIVQAVRATLAEMLAPLAGTLQSTLQQTIQQAVDQSLQQSVQHTIAPMIEAATTAQTRAVAALPQFQLPRVDAAPAIAAEAIRLPAVDQAFEPTISRAAEPVIEQPRYEPPVNAMPVVMPVPTAAPEQPTFEDEYATPAYSAYSTPTHDSQAYPAPTDASQGFDSQPYQPPGYDSRPYEQPAYDAATVEPVQNASGYSSPADHSPGFDSQSYNGQAYDAQTYDAQAEEVPAYDSQEYVPDSQLLAYDSQSYQPEVEVDSQPDSHAQTDDGRAEVAASDSHAQELPSWWADDPQTDQPASGPYQIGADNDAYHQPGHFPAHKNIAADQLPQHAQANDGMDQYAASAFSAEQLELGATDEDQIPDQYLANAEESPYLTGDDPMSAYAEPYAPADPELPDHQMVTSGADSEYASEDYQEYLSESTNHDAYNNISQPERITQAAPVSDNPTVAATETRSGEDTDESVEDYMRRLLARMRGVSESEVTIPGAQAEKPASVVVSKDPSVAQGAPVTEAEAENGEQLGEAWTEPFDPDKYVPRGSAPEKNRDLNALRELANTSARSAIQVSARRRQGSAILIKSSIALVGLIAGIALVSINGARINIAFIATVASFLVAVIWGYDASTSIRPLLQANRHQANQKRDSDKAIKAEEANS